MGPEGSFDLHMSPTKSLSNIIPPFMSPPPTTTAPPRPPSPPKVNLLTFVKKFTMNKLEPNQFVGKINFYIKY